MTRTSTFSIAGYDPTEEKLGIAVQSKFLAVGSVVPFASAKVGAVATQAAANTSFGPNGLDKLRKGLRPETIIDELVQRDPESETRQVGIVDTLGNSAAFTGEDCFDYAGHTTGENFCCQGNILVSEDTINSMAEVFTNTKEMALSHRLMKALKAGQGAGGDKRGKQSAALLVVKEDGGYGGFNDRYIDLRVDDHDTPIKELNRILELHQLYFEETSEEDLISLDLKTVERLQEMLSELGYYSGPIEGNYNEKTKKSFKDFCLTENFEEKLRDDNQIDKRILEFIEEEKLS